MKKRIVLLAAVIAVGLLSACRGVEMVLLQKLHQKQVRMRARHMWSMLVEL